MIRRQRNNAVKEKQRVGKHYSCFGEKKQDLCLLLQCNNDVTPYTVKVSDLQHSAPSKRHFKCFQSRA